MDEHRQLYKSDIDINKTQYVEYTTYLPTHWCNALFDEKYNYTLSDHKASVYTYSLIAVLLIEGTNKEHITKDINEMYSSDSLIAMSILIVMLSMVITIVNISLYKIVMEYMIWGMAVIVLLLSVIYHKIQIARLRCMFALKILDELISIANK